MAFSKIILNGDTLMDVTGKTVTAGTMLNGTTALANDGTDVTGNIASKTSSDLTASTLTVTAPAGYYASNATKTLTDANLTAGNIKKDVTVFGVTGTYEGSGGGSSDGDVIFIDYDGSIVTTKTKTEINAMTSDSDLPANPTHTGLTSQGWNWTVAQIKAQLTAMPNHKVYVGQMYVTTSGDTEIDITLEDATHLSPYLAVAVNGTITVDWGDNTTPDTMTGSNTSTLIYQQHTYAVTGNYKLTIHVASGTCYLSGGGGNQYPGIFRSVSGISDNAANTVYAYCVKAIRIGNNIRISERAFCRCGRMETITIPSTITDIEAEVFYYCYCLTSLTIPNGITKTNQNICQSCFLLTSVSIPAGVTQILANSFAFCYSLRDITIPSDVTRLDASAFSSCQLLADVAIPSGLTSLGSAAFSNCYSFHSDITIPSNITTIPASIFNGCNKIKSITIHNNVTAISTSSFGNCPSLQSITLPSKVTSIGSNAFQNCSGLENVTIQGNITLIDGYVFYQCFSLRSITIPNTATSIGNYAFYNCSSLEKITMSTAVTSIGNSAFSGCTILKTITLPSTLTSVGNSAFYNCKSMEEYHFQSTSVPTGGTTMFSGINANCVIYVPYSADHSILNAYQTANNWSTYATYMQEEPAP